MSGSGERIGGICMIVEAPRKILKVLILEARVCCAVVHGTTIPAVCGAPSGEPKKGTMELILSRPTTKTQVYICAGVLTLVGMFALVIVMFLGTVVATNIYDFSEPIPLHLFFRVAVNGGMLASAVGAIALMAAAVFRDRNMAVGVTVAFLVVNYFVEVISAWWPRMKFLQPATLFHYVNDVEIFT